MSKGDFLGEFEQLVMLALLRLGDQAYGMTIRREIEERARRSVAIGAVYATLDRLQSKGYVRSEVAEPTAERGGRAKRYFRLEANGERVLRETMEAMQRMTKGLRWSAS